jgi:hypothetical protein
MNADDIREIEDRVRTLVVQATDVLHRGDPTGATLLLEEVRVTALTHPSLDISGLIGAMVETFAADPDVRSKALQRLAGAVDLLETRPKEPPH